MLSDLFDEHLPLWTTSKQRHFRQKSEVVRSFLKFSKITECSTRKDAYQTRIKELYTNRLYGSPPLKGRGQGWGLCWPLFPSIYPYLHLSSSFISPTPPLSPPLHGWGTAVAQLSASRHSPSGAGKRSSLAEGKAIVSNGTYRIYKKKRRISRRAWTLKMKKLTANN